MLSGTKRKRLSHSGPSGHLSPLQTPTNHISAAHVALNSRLFSSCNRLLLWVRQVPGSNSSGAVHSLGRSKGGGRPASPPRHAQGRPCLSKTTPFCRHFSDRHCCGAACQIQECEPCLWEAEGVLEHASAPTALCVGPPGPASLTCSGGLNGRISLSDHAGASLTPDHTQNLRPPQW